MRPLGIIEISHDIFRTENNSLVVASQSVFVGSESALYSYLYAELLNYLYDFCVINMECM